MELFTSAGKLDYLPARGGVGGLIWVDLGLGHKNKQSFFSWKRLG
jgi:hypothetical protein